MQYKLFSQLLKGTYSGATSYSIGDIVNYNGSGYACKANTTGNLPTDTTYWALLASKGDKGDTGDTGNGIVSIIKTGTVGLTDTYTITFTDLTTTTYDVVNGEDGTDGVDGDDAYVYIAYASADDGTDFTLTFNSALDYIAIKTTTTAIVSPVASDFTGLWKNYKGTTGSTGATGPIGVDWQGAWSAGTYTATQAVSHNGSSWIATTTTSEEPSISATDWDLIALKGNDGIMSSVVAGTNITVDNTDPANPIISSSASLAKATQAEVATGTDDDKYVTPLAVQPYSNNSLYRQAIINGNFDVWQRSINYTGGLGGVLPVASDRWYWYNEEPVTSKSITKELLTSGDIFGSKYYQRFTVNGAGTWNATTQCVFFTRLENITSKLCGNGKTVTLSFYARASVANKKLGLLINQNYGTGGSVTNGENISGGTITLTSSWVKYTKTYTTNTLSGKTFGTNNDDYLEVTFGLGWGSTIGTNNGWGSAETFGGAGTIDIAQVQLNAGSVALPFQPKSYADELRDCQRYYQTRVVRTINGIMNYGLPVDLRVTPTVATASAGTIANATSTGYQITHNANADSTVVLSSEL